MQTLRLTDIDAAQRLTNLAIRLHFSQLDPLAIQALSNTSYKLLRKLSTEAKLPDIVPEYLKYLNAEGRQLFWTTLSAFDPISSPIIHGTTTPAIELAVEVTDLQLFISCALYRFLKHQHTHEMKIYIIWFKAINRLQDKADPIYNSNTKEGFEYLKSLPREKQLKMGFDALKNIRT